MYLDHELLRIISDHPIHKNKKKMNDFPNTCPNTRDMNTGMHQKSHILKIPELSL